VVRIALLADEPV
jgi:hypothetical protein